MVLPTARPNLEPSNFFYFTLSRQVNLYIPKFSMSDTYDLKDMLEDLNIKDLLTNQSDFSGNTKDVPLTLKVSVLGAFLQNLH